MIEIKNLCVTLSKQEIIKDISRTLPSGQIICCIGKSGAGKTTLLRTIAGLIKPSSGSIEIEGASIQTLDTRTRAQKVGFVFQDFNLFAHMNVLQNCIDPLLIQRVSREQAIKEALKILTQLGMAEKLNSFPHELSGGQQQRVAVARALCLQPAVLVMDEPTASLDPENSMILADILRALCATGLTVILSTQDMHFARTISDRILFMQNGTILEECEQVADCTDCRHIRSFLQAFRA